MTVKTTDRKFDTWEWRDQSTAPSGLTFEVRLERPLNVAEGPLRYYIKNEQPPISVEANDLGALRDRLDVAVRSFYAIAWEPVLVVRAKHDNPTVPSFELTFEVMEYERGMLFGEPVFRRAIAGQDVSPSERSYRYAMERGTLARSFIRFRNDDPRPQWVLHDTPSNRAMLRRFEEETARLLAGFVKHLDEAQKESDAQ